MTTARRRPSNRRPARRPARRPCGKAARRRQREARAFGGLLTAVFAIAAVTTYPVTSAIVITLVAITALTVYLARTGRLRLPTRVVQAPPGNYVHSIAAYQAMGPDDFEHAIAELARRDRAVRDTDVSGGKNDRGLDVLVTLHDGRRIAVQCKRYATTNRVGAPAIYTANGTFRAYHRCDQAVIVTTSAFTRDAERANAELDQPLTLIDHRRLTRWLSGGRPPWA